MEKERNRRGNWEYYKEGQHLKLEDLKTKAKDLHIGKEYLAKLDPGALYPIPPYPRPEFHLTRVKHDTDADGLKGILADNGFKAPYVPRMVWWSLVVGPDEINSAEEQLLTSTFPERTEKQTQTQQSFLKKFATSPAFEETSRWGSFRFTFPLEHVLKIYRDQICSSKEPVMRVFRTSLYEQDVMYTVLVHSPNDDGRFSDYPLLADDPNSVCSYRDGRIIWRSEAMCETHRYKLVKKDGENHMTEEGVMGFLQFFVWDHVALALYVGDQVMTFDAEDLKKNLTYCERTDGGEDGGEYGGLPSLGEFPSFQEAEKIVQNFWPNHELKKSGPVQNEAADK